MSVQIGAVTPRSSVTDPNGKGTTGLELYEAFGVYTLVLGGTTYVYVAAHEDNGISVFTLSANGTLTSVQNISDSNPNTFLELVGASQITSVTLASGTYLYVNSAIDDGLAVFEVDTATGALTSIQNITDTDTIELNGPEGKMQVATVGGATYLISPADDDDGIGIWSINADGTLTNVFNLTDAGDLQLHSASDAEVVQTGGHTYIYVASEDDPGISVFELNSNGSLTNIQNIHDNETLQLDGTAGLAVATMAGTTFVIASGAGDLDALGVPQSPEGLSVFAVGADGQLSNVFNLHDTAQLGLYGAMGMTTFVLDGETFVAVSAIRDNALSIFHVSANGALTNVTTLFDNGNVTLDGSYFNDFAVVGGTPYLLATGRHDNGVTVWDIGSGNDSLVGTAQADLQLGLAGNDTLDGGDGADTMSGGSGNDTYVVDNAGDVVREEANKGTDTVQASIDYTLGAHVEKLVLLGSGNLKGTGNDLDNTLIGNGEANSLTGGAGDDTLDGGAGQDGAVFSGNAASYRIVQNGDGSVTVTDLRNGSPDGTDDLVSIEQLRFADKVLLPDGSVAGNDPPTDITVQGGSVEENAEAGTVVAKLQATDPDLLDGLTFSLDDPTGTFVIAGDEIRVAAGAAIDFETRYSYAVTIAVSDGAGHSYNEALVISVTDVSPVIQGDGRDNRLKGTAEGDLIQARGGNDVLSGLGGEDRLEGGGGRDRLQGGAGDDLLLGGRGTDHLKGQGGADHFVFTKLGVSGAGKATRDVIEDFGSGDRIDLHAIDAVRGPGNQHFRLDKDGSFSAGEIRFHDTRVGLVVELNGDRDAQVEMSLLLKGLHSALSGGDFVL